MKKNVLIVAIFASVAVHAQTAPAWQHTQHADQLRGTVTEQYTLEGKFLTPSSNAKPGDAPTMVVRCSPDLKADHGHARGKLEDAFIYIGTIVDSGNGAPAGRVQVQYRRDGEKLHSDTWEVSNDFSAVYFVDGMTPARVFGFLLYGFHFPHKEGTGPQTKKLVIGLREYLGGEVVMQFDLPDSTEVADACGVIRHN